MASGNGGRIVRGSFIADGKAKQVRTPERPLRIELINTDDPAMGVYHDQMPDDSLFVGTEIVAGDNTSFGAFIKKDGVTINDFGFILGTDGHFNTAGEQIFYTVWF